MADLSTTAARSLLIKPVSGECNLHCQYCFYHERPSDPYQHEQHRHMDLVTLENLIRQGMQLDPRYAAFGWQGGEPTLAGLDFFRQAVELQKRYGHAGQVVSNGLQTNAILLDADWARFLREYRFLVGVSLDGPALLHDRYRRTLNGRPTHELVTRSLRLLRRFGVETNILTVVNHETAQQPEAIYDYLLELGFRYLQFIPCVEFDPTTGEPAEFSVTAEEYGEFLCRLFDRWYNRGNPESSIRDFDATLATCLGQPSPMCCYQQRCGSYVVVEYNGDLYPCDFFVREDLRIGNLADMSLEEAFASPALGRFGQVKAAPRAACQACQWMPYCQQGCPRFVRDGQHYLCRAYQRFWAHSKAGFQAMVDAIRQPAAAPATTPGRNDLCPCGSGIKYKHCCGRRSAH